MLETNVNNPIASEPIDQAGLGSQRYLELFKRLTPLIGNQDKDDICVRSCELIAELLEVEACSLVLANARRTGLQMAAATHIAREEWEKIELPIDSGICAQVFNEGKPQLIKGEEHFRQQFGRDSLSRYQTHSCVIVPLVIQKRVEGVVNVTNPVGRRAFRQSDVELLEAAVKLIASALATAIHYRETCQIHKNLEDVFDSLHLGIMSIDREGRVTQSNHRTRTLFRLNFEHHSKPELSEVLPGTIYNVCRRMIRQCIKENEPAQERIEVNLDGKRLMLEITASQMSCMGGTVSACWVMFEDVGQDEEVKRLRESESMKRNFLSIISHELRTPLAVLRGALPLIDPEQGKEIEPDTLRQVHRLMLKNCQRLNDVVCSILDVTEIESGTLMLMPRPMDLHELLDEVISLHAEGASNKRLVWDCRFEAEAAELCADRRRLQQVFSEMIANAIKFSNPGGRLAVHTRRTDKWLEVEISNHGAIIEPALRKTVFEKFSQGNPTMTRTVGGCGLGLFLVQNLMRLHGGQIALVDREENETTFILRLPLEPAAR